MNDGRVHAVRRTFTLDRHRDIAVARRVSRPAGKAVVGRTVTLDASRSRLAGGRLRGHWFLLRKPKLSQARLGAATGTRSRLRPDVPGTYLVGLRTRAGAGAGYDVLTVSATYTEPLVPIDTAATQNGQSGLQVGDQFYGYDSSAIQVIQLNGYTLEATHYNTYDATSSGLGQMKSDLSTAAPDALVFIAAPDGRQDLPGIRSATSTQRSVRSVDTWAPAGGSGTPHAGRETPPTATSTGSTTPGPTHDRPRPLHHRRDPRPAGRAGLAGDRGTDRGRGGTPRRDHGVPDPWRGLDGRHVGRLHPDPRTGPLRAGRHLRRRGRRRVRGDGGETRPSIPRAPTASTSWSWIAPR